MPRKQRLLLVLAAALLVFAGTVAPASAACALQGLRGGSVVILAPQGGESLKLSLSPAYGWDEKALIYGPDGRLLSHQPDSSRTETRSNEILLEKPGLYRVRLPRSLRADVEAAGLPVAFLPLRHETSLLGKNGRTLFFLVPEGLQNFSLYFSNRIGTRGEAVQMRITPPNGTFESLKLPAFTPSSLRAELGLWDNSNQALSEYSPDKLPAVLLPREKTFSRPEAGVWRLDFSGGECGVWFEGLPDLLAAEADHLQVIKAALVSAPGALAAVRLGGPLDHRPLLGAVGSFDPVRYREQRRAMGIEADQLFLWPPKSKGGKALSLPIAWARPDEPQMHTLLILRGRAPWMDNHARGRAAGFAEWAAAAVEDFLKQSGRKPESFTVQVFSEPNLEMSLEEYSQYFGAVVERFASVPALRALRLAGPALGSGREEDLLDWNWLETMLDRHGKHLAAICWNNYRLRDPEDSRQIRRAIDKTRELCALRGLAPDIFIGGINRLGGACRSRAFCGKRGGHLVGGHSCLSHQQR